MSIFNTRKTIGLFIENVSGLFQADIWNGVADAVSEKGYNIICFAGGTLRLSPYNPYEEQRNIIYSFVDQSVVDGLIIMGSLRNFITNSEFISFTSRYSKIPVFSLIPAVDTIPGILVDSYNGMHAVVNHLIRVHGCKRLAFICGPRRNIEAEQRLSIFKEVLEANGIPVYPNMILQGDFTKETAYREITILIDGGKRDFDAVVASNDEGALGAIQALQDRGMKVPDDVAVTGFDDLAESKFTTPPLTTVRQPIYEMGKKAAEAIIDLVDGRTIPHRMELQAFPVIRQSCGCFLNPQKKITLRSENLLRSGIDMAQTHRQITSELQAHLRSTPGIAEGALIPELVDAFLDEITGARTGVFLQSVNKIAREVILADADVLEWQEALTVLRAYGYNMEKTDRTILEDLLHDAYVLLGEMAARVQGHKRIVAEQEATLLREIGQRIANSFDLSHLLEVIALELPNVGVKDCFLSLYVKDIARARLIVALRDGNRVDTTSEQDFPSNQIIPEPFRSQLGQIQLVVEPLHYKDEPLGFIVLDRGQCNGAVFEVLRRHISGALKGTLLMQQVQEQAVALEQTNVQLQLLRDQEHEYLEAIRRELELGREIQSSFLPRELPRVDGWEISSAFLPAREVSGDFYDAFTLRDGRVVLAIADVSGKDVSAALFMSLIRTLIRALSEQALYGISDPLDAVAITNRYIINHHQGNGARYMYATLFLGVLDILENRITYINAGHNPPALVGASGGVREWINPTGPAVGMVIDADFQRSQVTLDPGEIFFAYTDGVTEARSPAGELLTKRRLTSLLVEQSPSAEVLVNRIEKAVMTHGAGSPPFDDITMLSVRRIR